METGLDKTMLLSWQDQIWRLAGHISKPILGQSQIFQNFEDDLVWEFQTSKINGPPCRLDVHSTMTGGGHLAIENGFESPKHRVSLGLLMNSDVHREHYTQAQ